MHPELEREAQEIRNGITFCMFCKGQYKGKCSMCRQPNAKIRKEFPRLVEHWKYVQQTKKKLKMYSQPTTGIPTLDTDCQPLPQTKPVAVVAKRVAVNVVTNEPEEIWYSWLYYNRTVTETGTTERDAKGNLALKASGWQPSVYSPNPGDYIWKAEEPDAIPATC